MPNWKAIIKSNEETLLNLLGFLIVGIVFYFTSVSVPAILAVMFTFSIIFIVTTLVSNLMQKRSTIELHKINDDLLELTNDKQNLKKTLYFPLKIEYWWNYLDLDNNAIFYKLNLRVTDIGGEVLQVVEELDYNASCPNDCEYRLEDFGKDSKIYTTHSVRELVADLIKVNGGVGKIKDLIPKEKLKLKELTDADNKSK